jgi:16S rRNA (cytidine1402-2'-O)-methyltransferase
MGGLRSDETICASGQTQSGAPCQPLTPLAPGLYLVATPIGNLADITLRALAVLKGADLVACEDTRVTGKLLAHYGIRATMLRYDDHSGTAEREALLARLRAGQRVALVSDAGTPLVSDPGYKLLRAAAAEGIAIARDIGLALKGLVQGVHISIGAEGVDAALQVLDGLT